MAVDDGGVLLGRGVECTGVAPAQVHLPLIPRRAAMGILERHEERVIVQPFGVVGAEGIKLSLLLRRGPVGKFGGDTAQQRRLPVVDCAEVDAFTREVGRGVEHVLVQQPLLDQRLQADQVGIARERAETLIRAVTVAGRPQGQNLPERLACVGEEIHPVIGGLIEAADAVTPRQRRRMQQNTAATN